MKKMLPVLLTLLLGTAPQTGCVQSHAFGHRPTALEEKVKRESPQGVPVEFYSSLEYKNFSEIDFDSLPKEKIPLPEPFEKNVLGYHTAWGFEDFSRFENEVLELARKQLPNGVENAPAKECLLAAMRIIIDKLEYKSDQENENLCSKRKYDLFFYAGTGDCDKYTKLFCEVFRVIKRHNANCENVYVTRQIGGDVLEHDWNSIWLVYDKNRLVTTHVDLTFADKDWVDLEATDYHLRKEGNAIKMALAVQMVDFEAALALLEEELQSATGSYFKELLCKKSLWSSIVCKVAKGENKMKYLQTVIDSLRDAKAMYMFGNDYSMILRNAICACRAIGNYEYADELMKEYETKFPHTPFKTPPPWE